MTYYFQPCRDLAMLRPLCLWLEEYETYVFMRHNKGVRGYEEVVQWLLSPEVKVFRELPGHDTVILPENIPDKEALLSHLSKHSKPGKPVKVFPKRLVGYLDQYPFIRPSGPGKFDSIEWLPFRTLLIPAVDIPIELMGPRIDMNGHLHIKWLNPYTYPIERPLPAQFFASRPTYR